MALHENSKKNSYISYQYMYHIVYAYVCKYYKFSKETMNLLSVHVVQVGNNKQQQKLAIYIYKH